MASLGAVYARYRHPPMNLGALGGGVIEDIYEPSPGRSTVGTYGGGEDWDIPCYGGETTVVIEYEYSIPDGGSATINDALVGFFVGDPIAYIPWDTINVGGSSTPGLKYWTDGDPGSTISQSSFVHCTATITDPIYGTIYNSIQGTSTTGINIYNLRISVVSTGEDCGTAPLSGATCEPTKATDAQIEPYSSLNFDVSYGPLTRVANSISTRVTVTAINSLDTRFSFSPASFSISDNARYIGEPLPSCTQYLPLTMHYVGGTGSVPIEDAEDGSYIEWAPSSIITAGDTWILDLVVDTIGASCDLVMLTITLCEGYWWSYLGLSLMYTLRSCGEVESPPEFQITWWEPGSKVYERGVDRGVLYFDDGRVVPWSGLTEVDERIGVGSEPVYFDGIKVSEIPTVDGFSASVLAISYPDQLESAYGQLELRNGIYLGEQAQKSFGFSYRNKLGTELDEDVGYKIHLVYNVIATPNDKNYTTISDDPSVIEFSWEFVAVPETLHEYASSAHLVLDTSEISPGLLDAIESILYGTDTIPPRLPPLYELIDLINDFENFITITDNGDGTWSANTDASGVINDLGGDVFEIQHATTQITGPDSYLISSTPDPPTI